MLKEKLERKVNMRVSWSRIEAQRSEDVNPATDNDHRVGLLVHGLVQQSGEHHAGIRSNDAAVIEQTAQVTRRCRILQGIAELRICYRAVAEHANGE